jgi:putative ABC transport system permease protein
MASDLNIGESFRVAFTVLNENKLRSGLTMLGIIIGVFAVVSLVSLGQSARRFVGDQFAGMGSNLLLVTPGKRETIHTSWIVNAAIRHKLTMADSEAVRKRVPSVNGAAPVIIFFGLAKYGGVSRNTLLSGTGPEYPFVREITPEFGRFFGQEDVDAERRVASLGSKVRTELFGAENPLGKFIQLMGTPFRVIGVMETKGSTFGIDFDDQVFIPVTAARRLFNTDNLSEILVRARSSEDVGPAEAAIRELIRARHDGAEDITIISQNEMLSVLNSILDALTFTLIAIAAVSLIVGGVGIMNIMLASVSERTREIGVRKATGARSRDIFVQFLIESVVLSLVGCLAGILLTFGAVFGARLAFPALPVAITLWAVVLAVTFSAAIGIFFGVFPARRASRLSPIEALRAE